MKPVDFLLEVPVEAISKRDKELALATPILIAGATETYTILSYYYSRENKRMVIDIEPTTK